jgi:hypothetical protein
VSLPAASPHARSAWRRVPVRTLSIVFSGAFLIAGFALFSYRIEWQEIVSVWSRFGVGWLSAALALYWLQYPINSFRLYLVVRWTGRSPANNALSFPFIFRLTCGSGFMAAVAPIGIVGDVTKILGLRLLAGLSLTEAARCAVFDRAVGVQWIGIIGLLTLPFQMAVDVPAVVVLTQFLLFIALELGIVVLLLMPRFLGLFSSNLVNRFANLFLGYGRMLSADRSIIQMMVALLSLASAGAALYALIVAAGLAVHPWLICLFVPLLQLINSVPFLYLGWGGREIALVATLGATGGLSINEALAISAAWGLTLMVTGVINGVFLIGPWWRQGRSQPSLDPPEPEG